MTWLLIYYCRCLDREDIKKLLEQAVTYNRPKTVLDILKKNDSCKISDTLLG